jgi:hypothetical protein
MPRCTLAHTLCASDQLLSVHCRTGTRRTQQPASHMAARRLGLRALSAVSPLLSGSAATGCNGITRGFMAATAGGSLTTGGNLLRRSAARHQPQLAQLLGGCRGFAQLPPHIELAMPSLSPTMERVRKVSYVKV